eukprot:gb/GECG01012224.1/.p1 GENE.gb/GECG01012224.1/~~gb/GECG01012224.1/.p1  ORF type:complete len:137 (+),score=12.31 gb/GECG01012224.1/:1-411(+)
MWLYSLRYFLQFSPSERFDYRRCPSTQRFSMLSRYVDIYFRFSLHLSINIDAMQAGAAAVLIIDDGSCTQDFQCGKWLGSREQGNMAALDISAEWANVFIPSALITLEQSERLTKLLDTKQISFGREKQTFVREPE